ncbi:hypothetical protein Acid345_2629 [Candidatus Koribacter versatilis Ellin345]|uniref:DUF1844 domain-containing protein n=1 Tax=Koribacter versatilis (strain Ellin345) TaxID=204669 RepID=Q1INC0_KORVE|nr:DUF1844 domain-containing protein [Candidatus Koribacter versatilis]ABF41630.1 hypothetical protein Acid345_2629 [Candidatus Koribacter versatilis Ellin345]
MADKKNESFTVTDRRKFTIDGDVRPDAPREEEAPAAPPAPEAKPDSNVKEFPKRAVEAPTAAAETEPEQPDAVSIEETRESAAAYKQSIADIDQHLAGQMKEQGRTPKDFEMNFEKLVASLYTTAIMQLGLDPASGQMKYQPDIIAARQTVDMLSILQEKTKGNLDAKEGRLLDSILYELRMAYIEITKMLTQAPPPGGSGKP